MNKIKASLAVLFALLLTLGLVSPASAYVTPVATAVLTTNTQFTNAVIFERQADGTGVKVNWTAIDAAVGCGNILSPKFNGGMFRIYNGNTGNLWFSQSIGASNTCVTPTRTFNQNGPDDGFVKVVYYEVVRWSGNNECYRVWFEWNLWPSGNSQLVYATTPHTDYSACH
jgi:hypothetical protein